MIDFIFGVSFTEHWHSLNLRQHRDHYSALGAGPFKTWQVSSVQDKFGAGVYYNTYVMVNGLLIKYGVVNLDTLCEDLSTWNTLYVAGRLHKPVKILRDDARVRLANQINLISALRTALLLLPPTFNEMELYGTIASISYMGDPRMSLPTEDPGKVANIVGNNLPHFRRLYEPLIETLPNVQFDDPLCTQKGWKTNPETNVRLVQDMDPLRRGNMVRRLPKAFREKLYFQYQKKYQIPQLEFNQIMQNPSNQGGGFEQRIIGEPEEDLRVELRGVIKKTIWWPSTVQSGKGLLTAGVAKSVRYMAEKMQKSRAGTKKLKEEAAAKAIEDQEKAGDHKSDEKKVDEK
jgi:translocator assembly and maintenance protein 41